MISSSSWLSQAIARVDRHLNERGADQDRHAVGAVITEPWMGSACELAGHHSGAVGGVDHRAKQGVIQLLEPGRFHIDHLTRYIQPVASVWKG